MGQEGAREVLDGGVRENREDLRGLSPPWDVIRS